MRPIAVNTLLAGQTGTVWVPGPGSSIMTRAEQLRVCGRDWHLRYFDVRSRSSVVLCNLISRSSPVLAPFMPRFSPTPALISPLFRWRPAQGMWRRQRRRWGCMILVVVVESVAPNMANIPAAVPRTVAVRRAAVHRAAVRRAAVRGAAGYRTVMQGQHHATMLQGHHAAM